MATGAQLIALFRYPRCNWESPLDERRRISTRRVRDSDTSISRRTIVKRNLVAQEATMTKDIFRLNDHSGGALFCILVLLTFVTVGTSNAQSESGTQSITSCTVIDKPGSYQLAKGVIATQNSLKTRSGSVPSCILIVADFVTLDLRGYTISGPDAGFGIYVHGGTASHVANGALTQLRQRGCQGPTTLMNAV
jgi:hypothetical protein